MEITEILYAVVVLFGLFGAGLCLHISKKKKTKKPMVCPLGADCNKVVTSEFSTFFGIKLEYLGVLYYTAIAFSYLLLLFVPFFNNDFVIFVLAGITAGSFFFSLYLTFVQAFYIKSWCTWCLISAGISTIIFIISIITLYLTNFQLIPVLQFLKTPIVMLHLVGFALGVGGATITDILFFKFMKDFKITIDEDKVLKIMSQVIWLGLFIVIISGLGLYIQNMEVLNQSSKFLTKVIVVLVIIINGSILNLYIHPKFISIYFDNENPKRPTCINIKKVNRLRKTAFALGSISFASWYIAFILGSLKSVPFTFIESVGLYIWLLIGFVLASQVLEKLFSLRKKKSKKIAL